MRKNRTRLLILTLLTVVLTLTEWGCFYADLCWVDRGSTLFYFLLAMGLFCGVSLMCAYFVAVYVPMKLYLSILHLAESEQADLGELLENHPKRGLFLNELFQLVSLLNEQEKKERNLEALKKEAELNALRSQINPHFLYNTLDSIRGQLMTQGFSEAADIIEALSNLFRYSINPRTVYNTLEQELDNVGNYMRIMRFRLGDRLSFQTIIDSENAFILNCEMPKLTLQPLVENAIQHGLEHTLNKGVITLRAYVAQDGLNILVSDNGCGMDAEKLDELNACIRSGESMKNGRGTGLALINVNERIRMLDGGRPFGLQVSSEPGVGTQVHVRLPVRLMPSSMPSRWEDSESRP